METNTTSNEQLTRNLGRIKHRIMVISGKGGVGKSTVSVNLAYGLALTGKKVGILDVDIHGPSIAKLLGIEDRRLERDEETGLPKPIKVHDNFHALTIASLLPDSDEPIIWRGPLKIATIKQFMQDIAWPELDYLIIDSPPGTGDEPLSVVQLFPGITNCVIVSTPQDIAFLDARKSIRFAQKVNLQVLGIIENMCAFVCPHCGEKIDLFEGTGAEKAAKDFKLEILGKIPVDSNIVKSGDMGRPYIYDFGKMPAAVEMTEIVNKIIEQIDKNALNSKL